MELHFSETWYVCMGSLGLTYGIVCLGIKEIIVASSHFIDEWCTGEVWACVYLQLMGAGPKHWGVIFWLANQNCLNH